MIYTTVKDARNACRKRNSARTSSREPYYYPVLMPRTGGLYGLAEGPEPLEPQHSAVKRLAHLSPADAIRASRTAYRNRAELWELRRELAGTEAT